MTPDPDPPLRAWLVVALLWFVACFNYLARIMITTMHGSIVHSIPMTETDFGLLTSVFLWTYGLLSPVAGFMADRFSRSRVIVISLFAWSATTWLTAYASNFSELLVMRVLMGVSEACYLPAALALITDYHRGPTRSLATGVHMTGIMFGSALGGLGGWLAEMRSWGYAFTVLGLSGIAYSAVLLLALRDAPREDNRADAVKQAGAPARFWPAIVSLFSNRGFILILVYWGLLGTVGWAVAGWMPVYVQEHFHLGQGAAGVSATAYVNIAALVGVLIGGAWADRWARRNEVGRIYVTVIGLCAAAPGILLTANSDLLSVAIAGLTLFGVARAFTDANMMPILCMVSDPRYRATGYGFLNALSCVVGGLAIYAGGALRDARVDLSHVFQFSAVSMIVCAGLLIWVRRQKDPVVEAAVTEQARL